MALTRHFGDGVSTHFPVQFTPTQDFTATVGGEVAVISSSTPTGVFFSVAPAAGDEILITHTAGAFEDPPAEEQTAWTDLRFPAQAINPAGAADAPSIDTVLTSFPGTLLFAGNQENVITGIAQMPHEWLKGTALKPHIHWSKPTGSASAVSWVFYYRHIGSPGDAPGAWVGPLAGTLVAGDQTVSNEHLLVSFDDISMTGLKESTILNWQIRRLGNSDADNGTARLYEFDLHFQVDPGKYGTESDIPT
jgi:hypothetical protein